MGFCGLGFSLDLLPSLGKLASFDAHPTRPLAHWPYRMAETCGQKWGCARELKKKKKTSQRINNPLNKWEMN
jgi:hypothetical protein